MAARAVIPARTQLERSRATTRQLLDAARELFAADGYAASSLDSVVERAGVTKGALYHHFPGKRELFAAVYKREQSTLAGTVEAAYRRKNNSWEGFRAGCRAFFDASLDPGVQRITLLDAPGALGWQQMREIEADYSLALLKRGIAAAIEDGHIPARPIDPLAHLLLGAMCEAAMMVARSQDQKAETRRYLNELKRLLDGLIP